MTKYWTLSVEDFGKIRKADIEVAPLTLINPQVRQTKREWRILPITTEPEKGGFPLEILKKNGIPLFANSDATPIGRSILAKRSFDM